MAKNKDEDKPTRAPAQVPVAQRDPEPPAPKKAPEPVFTFDRYFATLGKPAHHKAGMKAFLKSQSNSKKTVAEWDRVFKNY